MKSRSSLPGWIVAAACSLVILPACSWDYFKKMDPNVVATVNGLPITVQEVDERFTRLEKELENQPLNKKKEALQLKRAIVGELIARKLLVSEAQARGLSVSNEEIVKEKEKLASSLTPFELKEAMDQAKTTPERFEDSIREEILILRLMDLISAGISVSDSEIADFYERNRSQFYQQESVRARHIVVNTQEEAKRVRRRLVAGENFTTVAGETSMSPDAGRGGDLGVFQKGQMPQELEAAAFALVPGYVSPPIETPYGYHILKVEEKLPAKQLDLAAVKSSIISTLLPRKREERYVKLLAELREKAKIRHNRKHEDLRPKKEKAKKT